MEILYNVKGQKRHVKADSIVYPLLSFPAGWRSMHCRGSFEEVEEIYSRR